MRKFLFIIAFLCASVMGWAAPQNTYLGCDGGLETYANTYKWFSLEGATAPNEVVSIQSPAWTGLVECGIYVNVGTDYDGVKFNGSAVTVADYCYIQGTGGILYISHFTDKCTTVEFTNNGTVVRGMRIQNDNGTGDACATAASGPVPTTAPANDESRELCQVMGVLGTTKYSAPGITRYESVGWGGSAHEVVSIGGKNVEHVYNGTASAMGCGDVDVRGMTNVQFDIWCESEVTLGLQMVCWNGGWQHGTKKTFTTTAEGWKTVNFAISEFEQSSDNLKTMVLLYFQDLNNTPFYITNIYYYTTSIACASEPETAPLAPSQKACQVYSLYSDYNYTGQFAQMNNALWCGGYAEDVVIAGKKVKYLHGSSGCYGFEKNGWNTEGLIDVSDYDYLHIDVWVPQITTLEMRPIIRNSTDNGNDPEKYVRREITTTGSWQSINIPLSEYTSQGVNFERLYQFNFEGLSGKKVWFTNLYFFKSADCTPDYDNWNLALGKPAYAGKEVSGSEVSKANNGIITDRWATGQWPNITTQWWYVDLGANYDLKRIEILFDNAYPTSYVLQAATEDPAEDETKWSNLLPQFTDVEPGHSNNGTDAETNKNTYNVSGNVGRWVRIKSLANSLGGEWGFSMWEFRVFGSEAATATKSVSASVNDANMGTASVKQNNVDVTEVETGSTVTFSAVANEGYLFVDWSNGNTNASFDAEVDANMNLTANFRALNHISCNEEMTSGNYTAYVTYRKTANENEYEFIVRSAQVMTGFSNAYIGHINGNGEANLNGQGSLTANGHKLSYTFTSTTTPKLNTPLYVNFANHGEVTFNQINNGTVFEFALPCEDPEITAIELNKTEATLDMGNSLTLVPTFTPAYMSADIEWQTSDNTIATVANGVVTPVAPGNVTITAKISETIKATCAVTVQASQSHNWYGYGTSEDLDYTYRIEYTTDHHIVAHVKRQGAKTGLVDVGMNINNVWTSINVTEGEETGWKKGTTEATYTAGDNITIILQSNWAGPSSIINIPYTVGADNVMPTIEPSVLKLSTTSMTMSIDDADVQLTTEIHHRDAANQTITWTSDDENVVTVVDGLVHPVGVGTTTVRANTFNDIEATCDVTIVGVLEPTVFWDNGTDHDVHIAYSITRNTNHTLTYAVEVMQNKVDFGVQVNDGQYHTATLNEGIYTWTSTATYTDGDSFSGFIYMPFNNGAARVDFSYTVGSESVRKYIPITLKDDDNDFVISASDNVIREAKLNRTFPNTDEWYTLCLPFDLSDAQLTEVFGAGYTLAEMVGAEDRGSLLHLNFDYIHSFEAGKAYLLRPGTSVTTAPTFNGVTIKNVNPATLKSTNTYMEFQGTFESILLNSDNQRFVGPENYLYSPAANGTTMKAFRCYFTIPNNAPNNVISKRAKIVFGPQATTDIENVQDNVQCTKVLRDGQLYIIRDGRTYDAQGQLIK